MQEVEIAEALRATRDWKPSWHRIGQVLKAHLEGENDRARVAAVLEAAGGKRPSSRPIILKRLVVIAERLERVSQERGNRHLGLGFGLLWCGRVGIASLRSRSEGRACERCRTCARAGSPSPNCSARFRWHRPDRPTPRRPRARRRWCAGRRPSGSAGRRIEGYVHREFGRRAQTRPRPVMRHLHRLGFEAAADGRVLAGIDLHLQEPAVQSKDTDGLARSLLLARYLPVFALALAQGPGPNLPAETAREWAKAADLLGMGWVGMLAIGADGAVDPLREAASNPHNPDPAIYLAARGSACGQEGGRGDAGQVPEGGESEDE